MTRSNDISLFSYSHRNTPMEMRDKLTFSADEVHAFVPEVKAAIGGEVAILSTCNRTEFYMFGAESTWDQFSEFVVQAKQIAGTSNVHPTHFRGREAARHLFRVASSIESLALGEDQILSQVKSVHGSILEASGKSPVLDRLYQYAIRVGKRVRTETSLCDGAVSISSAAVELAKRIFGDFGPLHIALVGAGETSTSAAEHFKAAGGTQFTVVNRGEERGQALAAAFSGTYQPLSELDSVLREADVVVLATGSPTHLITKKAMRSIMKARSHRSIFLIDISNPRNVQPSVSGVSGVFLFNIDDLESVVKENLKERQREIPAAEHIIEEVLVEWDMWMQAMKVRPTIGHLAKHFEDLRQQELGRQKNLSEAEAELLQGFSRSLVKKLLHDPIMFLRTSVDESSLRPEDVDLVRKLFKLDRDDS